MMTRMMIPIADDAIGVVVVIEIDDEKERYEVYYSYRIIQFYYYHSLFLLLLSQHRRRVGVGRDQDPLNGAPIGTETEIEI